MSSEDAVELVKKRKLDEDDEGVEEGSIISKKSNKMENASSNSAAGIHTNSASIDSSSKPDHLYDASVWNFSSSTETAKEALSSTSSKGGENTNINSIVADSLPQKDILSIKKIEEIMEKEKKPYSYITGEPLIDLCDKDKLLTPMHILIEQAPLPMLNVFPKVTYDNIDATMADMVGIVQYHGEREDAMKKYNTEFMYGSLKSFTSSGKHIDLLKNTEQDPEIINIDQIEQVHNCTSIAYLSHIISIDTIETICKKILPTHIMLSKEALFSIQECVINFVSLITAEAGIYSVSDIKQPSSSSSSSSSSTTTNTRSSGPPLVLGSDVVNSLKSLGFVSYSKVIEIFLMKYQQQQNLFSLLEKQKQEQARAQALAQDQAHEEAQ
jgi:hypothetical protein